jgi:hypothetical protein
MDHRACSVLRVGDSCPMVGCVGVVELWSDKLGRSDANLACSRRCGGWWVSERYRDGLWIRVSRLISDIL